MIIDKNTKASASANPENDLRDVAAPSRPPIENDDARGIAREDDQDDEEGRSLAFVYVIVALLVGLGAIGWAVSAIL